MQEKAKKYNKDYKKMVSKLNRYPTDAEIQKELKFLIKVCNKSKLLTLKLQV